MVDEFVTTNGTIDSAFTTARWRNLGMDSAHSTPCTDMRNQYNLIQLNSAIRYRTVTESSMIMLLVGGVPFVLRHFRNFGLLKLKVFVDEEVELE